MATQTYNKDSSESVVDSQLAAYNRRNIESFVSFYSDDIVVRRHGEPRPLLTGKAELRLHYQELFRTSPGLRAEVTDRQVRDGYVIDREDVIGMRGDPGHIYFTVKTRVEEGLIVEVIIKPE